MEIPMCVGTFWTVRLIASVHGWGVSMKFHCILIIHTICILLRVLARTCICTCTFHSTWFGSVTFRSTMASDGTRGRMMRHPNSSSDTPPPSLAGQPANYKTIRRDWLKLFSVCITTFVNAYLTFLLPARTYLLHMHHATGHRVYVLCLS